MKLIVLLAIVLAIVWLARRGNRPNVPGENFHDALPQDVLACAHCGLHMPSTEALPGRGGVFCSEAHRAAFEQAHPGP